MRAGTIVFTIASALLVSTYCAVGSTSIEVLPVYDFKESGDIFQVEVVCTPTEPVKAFEMQIQFNQTKLEATSVTIENFFGEYPVFLSEPKIDNINGTITDLYALIIGIGNISIAGIMATIEFVALENEGVSHIDLVEVGITNETQYLEKEVSGAEVQTYIIYPPWDTNKDGLVNAVDISCVVSEYGHTCVEGKAGDINWDGVVNYVDVSLMVTYYGK
jgi:hypothetical protein